MQVRSIRKFSREFYFRDSVKRQIKIRDLGLIYLQ